MIFSVYGLDKMWALDKKYLKFLLPNPPCYLNMTLIVSSLYTFSSMWDIIPRSDLSDTEVQKAPETQKPDPWSVLLSEKDFDQKGFFFKITTQKPQLNKFGRQEG